MADSRRRAFDAIAVFRFDRFARSVSHLARALDEFRALGIEFVSLHEAVDTSTPMGRAMFHIAGAFAGLEREIIRERVKAGLQNARRRGKRLGGDGRWFAFEGGARGEDFLSEVLRRVRSRIRGCERARFDGARCDLDRRDGDGAHFRSDRGSPEPPPCLRLLAARRPFCRNLARQPVLQTVISRGSVHGGDRCTEERCCVG